MKSLSSLFCLQRQYLGNNNNAQFVRGSIVTGLSRLSPRAINNVVWTVAKQNVIKLDHSQWQVFIQKAITLVLKELSKMDYPDCNFIHLLYHNFPLVSCYFPRLCSLSHSQTACLLLLLLLLYKWLIDISDFGQRSCKS